MVITSNHAVLETIDFWKSQQIDTTHITLKYIAQVMTEKAFVLPIDFVNFYLQVNGMEKLYPNYSDTEGFLFYPVEALYYTQDNQTLVFADYMQCSWWYGVQAETEEKYTIGILPTRDQFIPLTNSLEEFLGWYRQDHEMMYAVD
jgi:hypothetical protein